MYDAFNQINDSRLVCNLNLKNGKENLEISLKAVKIGCP